jgi:hypothetical protein
MSFKETSYCYDCQCQSCITKDYIYSDIEKMRYEYNIIYYYNKTFNNQLTNITLYKYIASCVPEKKIINNLNNCKICCLCKNNKDKFLTSEYDKDAWSDDDCSCSYIRRVLCKSLNEYY